MPLRTLLACQAAAIFSLLPAACMESDLPEYSPEPCDCETCESCVRDLFDTPRCRATPKAALRCAEDGNAHWYDSCGRDEGIALHCPAGAACAVVAGEEPRCICADSDETTACGEATASETTTSPSRN